MGRKLRNWLKSNRIKRGGVVRTFILSHQGRAIILLYLIIYSRNRFVRQCARKILRAYYHIECSCNDIGYGLMLPHPRNIIISAEKIGDNVQINQNVTIGGNMRRTVNREWGLQKLPRIGNNVVIYTNAVVGGPVVIGDHVIIGSNCTCTHDVEAHTILHQCTKVSSRHINVLPGTFEYID